MGKKKRIASLLSLLVISLLLARNKPKIKPVSAAPPPIPNPLILSYGGFDSVFEPTLLNEERETPVPNVVESRVSINYPQEAKEGVKILIEKGVLPAFHVPSLPRTGHTYWWNDLDCVNNEANFEACVQYNVDLWESAFTNDLDGFLPGGYKALAVDEIGLWTEDENSRRTRIKLETLKRVKQNYPDRLIFVWGCCIGSEEGTSLSIKTLTYIKNYADRMIYEIYLPELTPQSRRDYYFSKYFKNRILNLKNACQGKSCEGVLAKTVIGLGTADTEDWAYDRDPSVDFPDFLDAEIHYIRNTSILKDLPGIAFYSYALTRPETITWINKLVRHYYLDRQTSFLGDGNDALTYVSNPSFEQSDGWEFRPGSGGQITYKDTAAVGLTTPGKLPRVPHGNRVLYMKKGSSQNVVTQTISLSPRSFYHLDVYAKKQTPPYEAAHADVQVIDAAGNSLISFKEKKEVDSSSRLDFVAKYHNWTRFRIEFKTPPEIKTVKIILSDNQVVPGEVTLWDFIELERLKAGSLTAGLGGQNVSQEIFKNPGFEQGLFYWREWQAYNNTLHGQAVSSPVKDGAKSLLVQSDVGTDVWRQDIFLQPPQVYKISGWVYLKETSENGKAYLYVRGIKNQGGSTDFSVLTDSSRLNQWQYIEKEFQFGWAYKNVAEAASRTTGATKAFFDELKIEAGGSAIATPTPSPPSLSLSPGWNQVTWLNVAGKKASDIPDACPIAVSQQNFWFKPYVKNFGGANFELEGGKIYYLKCNQEVVWTL
ncbi:MAG TPA: carbohydrate binding domain-containing protein [Candidatus Bathyarchaeia archaeon]|nr:carbohydrate binding domain-containing protein [Candidatus Bathyarchaeia archaeon]